MKVYCSHTVKVFHKSSNFYQCRLCPAHWYVGQDIPIVVVGFTDAYEVDSDYMTRHAEKDLTKKSFKRCNICKDLLEKRKHNLCHFKVWLKELGKRHIEYVANITIVLKGFKRGE